MSCEHLYLLQNGFQGAPPVFKWSSFFLVGVQQVTTGYLEPAMNRFKLAQILRGALERYAQWGYEKVEGLADEPLVESTAEGSPQTNKEYWQIEVRLLQKWAEGDVNVAQLFAEISDGRHFIGTTIEYLSNGLTLVGEALVEYVNGVPRPLDESNGSGSGSGSN